MYGLGEDVVPMPSAAVPAPAPAAAKAIADPAMVQRVAADVVAATPGQPPEVQKQAAISAVAGVLAQAKPYTDVGQSVMGMAAVAGGVLALIGGIFGKAKAIHAKFKGTPAVAANPRRRRRSRR